MSLFAVNQMEKQNQIVLMHFADSVLINTSCIKFFQKLKLFCFKFFQILKLCFPD